jgi:hypothetical protein
LASTAVELLSEVADAPSLAPRGNLWGFGRYLPSVGSAFPKRQLCEDNAGSIPADPTIIGLLAQLEERLSYKQKVVGSSPTRPTLKNVT